MGFFTASGDFVGLSDAALDAAFSASYKLGDVATAQRYTEEIINRLANPFSFIGGLFGQQRFPLYEEVSTFNQSDGARESVADNALDVSTNLFSGVKIGAFIIVAVLIYKATK